MLSFVHIIISKKTTVSFRDRFQVKEHCKSNISIALSRICLILGSNNMDRRATPICFRIRPHTYCHMSRCQWCKLGRTPSYSSSRWGLGARSKLLVGARVFCMGRVRHSLCIPRSTRDNIRYQMCCRLLSTHDHLAWLYSTCHNQNSVFLSCSCSELQQYIEPE